MILIKLVVLALIAYAIYRGPWSTIAAFMRRRGGSPQPRRNRAKGTVKGRVGGAVASHGLIWLLMNPVTLTVTLPVVILALAIPLKMMGIPVYLPEYVLAVPRAAYERVKDLFMDKAAEARAAAKKAREAYEQQQKVWRARKEGAEAKVAALKAKADAEKERLKAEAAEKGRQAAAELNEKKLQAMKLAGEAAVEAAVKAALNGELWDGAPLPLRIAASFVKAGRRIAGWSAEELPRLRAAAVQMSEGQIQLEREKLWLRETEAQWRSYRASEPLSRMTLGQYRIAVQDGNWAYEQNLVKHRKWRLWNRGIDAR